MERVCWNVRDRILSFRSGTDSGFWRYVSPFRNPQNQKSQEVIFWERDGYSVRKWRIITSSSVKCCLIYYMFYHYIRTNLRRCKILNKLCIQDIHAVEVAKLWNPLTHHCTFAFQRNKSEFVLQFLLQKSRLSDKWVVKLLYLLYFSGHNSYFWIRGIFPATLEICGC